MCVREIRVKQIRVNQGLGVFDNFVSRSTDLKLTTGLINNDFGGSIPNVTVHVSYVYNSLLLPYTTVQCVLPKMSHSTGCN